MDGMDKNPRNEREMIAQATKASLRTFIFSGWIFGKLLRPVLKLIKGGFRMVFGRKKKDKGDPSFASPMAAQQMAQFNQQLVGGGYPYQQQQVQPPAQEYPYPQQPMEVQQAQPVQQPMQPPVQQPMAPVQRPMGRPAPPQPIAAGPSILEQLMMADMSLAEHLKSFNARLFAIEEYLQQLDQQLDHLFERLNLVQGVQPAGGKRTKFQKH